MKTAFYYLNNQYQNIGTGSNNSHLQHSNFLKIYIMTVTGRVASKHPFGLPCDGMPQAVMFEWFQAPHQRGTTGYHHFQARRTCWLCCVSSVVFFTVILTVIGPSLASSFSFSAVAHWVKATFAKPSKLESWTVLSLHSAHSYTCTFC